MNIYNYSINREKSPEIQECYFVDDMLEIREASGKVTRLAIDSLDTLAATLMRHYGAQEASELYNQSISERNYSIQPLAIVNNIALWITAIPALPFLLIMSVMSHDAPQSAGTTTVPDYLLYRSIMALGNSLEGFLPNRAYEQSNAILLDDLRIGAKNLGRLNITLAQNERSKPIVASPSFAAHMHLITTQIASFK